MRRSRSIVSFSIFLKSWNARSTFPKCISLHWAKRSIFWRSISSQAENFKEFDAVLPPLLSALAAWDKNRIINFANASLNSSPPFGTGNSAHFIISDALDPLSSVSLMYVFNSFRTQSPVFVAGDTFKSSLCKKMKHSSFKTFVNVKARVLWQ